MIQLRSRFLFVRSASALIALYAAVFVAGCGGEANGAKYLAAEFAFEACERAVLTHGGMGYAKEFHVERLFREIMIARIAPISRELVLSYIGERQLGLPKSY